MKFEVVHRLPASPRHAIRLRVRASSPLPHKIAVILARELESLNGLFKIKVNHRTGSVLLMASDENSEKRAIDYLDKWDGNGEHKGITAEEIENLLTGDAPGGATIALVRFFLIRPFLPIFWRIIVSTASAIPFLIKGFKSLMRGKLNVDVLDASALLTSLLTKDYTTVGMLTMLLVLGESLERWTREKSVSSLTKSLALHVDNVWQLLPDGSILESPLENIIEGDLLIIHAGAAIPVDGIVVEGNGLVNQASMTGESLPVVKERGGAVFAGTVLESGELTIKVTQVGESTRLQQVVAFIEQSEEQKSKLEAHYLKIADRAVPFTFGIAGLVFLFTGSFMRASAVLLVDYSCALKLATPLAVLSAMRQASKSGVAIRGGKYLERMQQADTLVFDKTGTLTGAVPAVSVVIPAKGHSRREVLKIMACLEEHFPHPVARAVVNQANMEGVGHKEEHTEVEYIVAHGIASNLHGHRMHFGSRHYIEHDEKVNLDIFGEEIAKESSKGHSVLFLAQDGQAIGMLSIEDPIRKEACQVINELRALGFRHVLMLTGDDYRTAKAVAEALGITEFRSNILPNEKAKIIQELNADGCKVVMVGDGINDGPALSAASVGIAMGSGTDLARVVANVLLTRPGLHDLVTARLISNATLKRIHFNFGAAMLLNSIYMAGAVFSILSPALSAILHNLTTLAISVNAIRSYGNFNGKNPGGAFFPRLKALIAKNN